MTMGLKLALCAGAAALAGAFIVGPVAQAQPAQKVTGPVATYWVSTQTTSGMGLPGMGGGARPDPGAMMRAMMGGGGANKSMQLDLGSRTAASAPAAEHVPPPGLQAGASLPLLTPRIERVETPEERPEIPREFQQPKGKMLIFWGCGERAKPGQPVVIDFATVAKNPQAMAGLMKAIDVRPMQPPAPGRATTYGGWPNEKTKVTVPPAGSLVGNHLIHGNYTPDIEFKLTAAQDFLAPINLHTNDRAPGGWGNLAWDQVPNARAYLATAFGGSGQDTVVMWTSSETQAQAFGAPDYLSPPDIVRLVNAKTLMPPTQTTCAVPKEFMDAAGQAAMLQMTAYGGEANFVHPPRPEDPKIAWNKEWEVKVRYRSSTGGILGMSMPAMPDVAGARGAPADRPGAAPPGQQPPRAPSATDILRGLGGFGIPRPR